VYVTSRLRARGATWGMGRKEAGTHGAQRGNGKRGRQPTTLAIIVEDTISSEGVVS